MRLVGVGVGPGDPDLVTLRAVRELQAADLVVVPVLAAEAGRSQEPGRAERTVRAHLTHDRLWRAVLALDDRGGVTAARAAAWDAAADTIAGHLRRSRGTVVCATIGDPNIYSTFTYLRAAVTERVPEVVVETVPGITAMQALAAATGTVLCEGRETLTLVPLTAGAAAFDAALTQGPGRHGTVVAYKGGRHLADVAAVLARHGRDATAVVGSEVGLPGERLGRLAEQTSPAPYLSTVIAPASRPVRGGKL